MTRPHDPRTTDLLRGALDTNGGETITLEQFLAPLESRAYGFLLVLLALPNFIPIPIGIGGVMGIIVVLIGLQMLVGMNRPWLPRFARRHGFARSSVEQFVGRLAPLLGRIERVCRPRWEQLMRKPVSHFGGLILVLLGALLSLPIPFTNYPFGVLVLLYGVALIERDGILLSIVWIGIAASLATVGSLGTVIVEMLARWFG